MNAPRALPRLSALLAASALAAGCDKIQHTALEEVISQDLTRKGVHMKSVTCPEGKEFKQDSFDCSGVDDGGKPVVFKVSIRPTEGGKADIKYTTTINGKPYAN